MLKESQGSINGIKTENTSNQNQRKTIFFREVERIPFREAAFVAKKE